MAVSGKVGGSCHAPLQEQDQHCAVNWQGLAACCTRRSKQGSPAGEGGEAVLPRRVLTWQVLEGCRGQLSCGLCRGTGGTEGMTAPAPVLNVFQSPVSQKRLF